MTKAERRREARRERVGAAAVRTVKDTEVLEWDPLDRPCPACGVMIGDPCRSKAITAAQPAEYYHPDRWKRARKSPPSLLDGES